MRTSLALLLLASTLIPSAFAHAFPFGGQITLFHVCYNETLFARLSPPVPGDYVWTKATRTYQFGPPKSTGQWLLGLTGIPFDCLWSVSPIFPVPAIAIMMMGSSQAGPLRMSSGSYSADPTQLRGGSGGFGNANPTYTGAPQYTGGAPVATNVVISEVFAGVDVAHGADPGEEWVEVFNGTNTQIDISGWTIQTSSSTDVIPQGSSVAPGSFVLITEKATLRNFWSIPIDVRMVTLGTPIGDGLSIASDGVQLRDKTGAIVDAVSWGASAVAVSPPAPSVPVGRSLSRNSIFTDTNASSDWTNATPSPGN